MWTERQRRLLIVGALGAAALLAQDSPLPSEKVNINLPKDSPVALLGMSTDQSRAQSLGAALRLDLHMLLTLRNSSQSRIRGLTLRVVSQEVVAMGRGSVTLSSMNVGPGEAFPVRIDMQLMHPMQTAGGALVEVNLDGVLFEDLSFFGPDRLNSRRMLTAWEMEAQRDREHFRRVLAQSGRDGLAREIRASMARQADRPQLDVRVRPGGPAVTSAAAAERTEQFAFLELPDSPVQAVSGSVQVAGNAARAPHILVRNRSKQPVKYVELGWLVRDPAGRQYMAASVPASESQPLLSAGQTGQVSQDAVLTFTHGGRPVNIQGMTGFISEVQFADGKVWVPNRQNLDDTVLQQVLPPSAEEQRLADLYTRKGVDALIAELKKH